MSKDSCVEVVRLGPCERLPNSDTLSITQVLGGYPTIFKTDEFKEGDLAIYVPVDSLVPTDNELFSFLKSGNRNTSRIRARKLRGTFSMGLLVPNVLNATPGSVVGDKLGIEKYLPKSEQEHPIHPHNKLKQARKSETVRFDRTVYAITALANIVVLVLVKSYFDFVFAFLSVLVARGVIDYNRYLNKRPNYPVYDIDSIRRFGDVLELGEQAYITEKLHGSNMSVCHTGKRFHVKSRTIFREDTSDSPSLGEYKPKKDVFWKIAKRYGLKDKLSKHPNIVLYGECYGKVQDLDYGVSNEEEVRFAAFDAMYLDTRKYMNVSEFLQFCKDIDVPVVPALYSGPWDPQLVSLAEGKTVMPGANHVREGIVVKPLVERRSPLIGRVILKLSGEGYHLRKSDKNES